jgi:DNA-directed RNA polymerase subunit omega
MSELLEHVDSRYLLVNLVARRARQIALEAEEFHEPLTEKPVTQAILEVARGELTAEVKESYVE